MPLYIIATPIGNNKDITIRALEVLKASTHIIVEDRRIGSQLLKSLNYVGKTLELLSEHSIPEDVEKLADLCISNQVALISDCGTPVFQDPGAELIRLCRKKKISVQSLPGASSLMALLSLSSQRINQFYFRGFLPQETEERKKQWLLLKKENQAIVLMDTPYRLEKTLNELKQYFSERRALLCLNLTQENEEIFEDQAGELIDKIQNKKAEFMILIYPRCK